MALYIYFDIKLSGDNIAAFGYAHKTNFLKFRILEALFYSTEPLTTRDIERITGVQYTTVSAAMSRYQKISKRNGKTIKLPYIQRLAKKGPNGLYRYKITQKGIEAYFQYLQRIRRGFSLKRVGKPQHMETYGKFPCGHIRTEEDLKLCGAFAEISAQLDTKTLRDSKKKIVDVFLVTGLASARNPLIQLWIRESKISCERFARNVR